MALTAVHVSDVPMLDQVPEMSISTTRVLPKVMEIVRSGTGGGKFLVIGHRGKGMNLLSSSDPRMKAVKENSIASFNAAGKFHVDLVEFDVQVGKPLLRKLKEGRVFNWNVETDSPSCTLEEAFQRVDSHLGFNIELKFDDHLVYQEKELTQFLQAILHVVFEHAHGRSIVFSSFQPDAAQVMRKLQNVYPVYFLTNGGTEIYADSRRNSLEEAINHSLSSGLQGIVSEVKALFRNPTMIPRIKESNLDLLTYGQLNNVPEAVYMQHLMGINGVIVDLVEKITDAVSDFTTTGDTELGNSLGEGKEEMKPKFSQRELSFLLKLIPELVQH